MTMVGLKAWASLHQRGSKGRRVGEINREERCERNKLEREDRFTDKQVNIPAYVLVSPY